jgi:hypothetical protein
MNSTQITGTIGAFAAAAMVLAGCGTSNDGGSGVGASSVSPPVEVGNTINYSSVGTTAEVDCANGKSLTVGGANNTLTVKGTCAKANIGGTDNKVTFDKIDQQLDVVGMHATVTYKDGSPRVNDTGSGNTIRKG